MHDHHYAHTQLSLKSTKSRLVEQISTNVEWLVHYSTCQVQFDQQSLNNCVKESGVFPSFECLPLQLCQDFAIASFPKQFQAATRFSCVSCITIELHLRIG
ncbi:hypothetical protein Csa_002019 [Cucumis sativus]|uniref:Uncharacterized protein n=1 Tax=Cucumis sativus TaxID=3659 RepID=A0A0A0LG77_CUCSA|nr:hypothetical protein Csa_002019 [Cucumis sativus]